LEEINSIAPQLTFAKIMSGTKEPEPTPTEPGRPSSKSSGYMSTRKRPSLWNIPGLSGRRFLQINGRLVAKNPPVMEGEMPLYKVVVLGDGGVGKDALIIQVR
jgi:hypothetical protein